MNEQIKRKAGFLSLGCKVNSYETDAIIKLFKNADYEIVGFNEEADVYIVNTCTVTNIADRKSRQMLHRAKKNNENAIVVAMGCYVQASKEDIKKDLSVDIIIGNNNKNMVVELVEEYFKNNQKKISVLEEISNNYEELEIENVNEKTRAYIKIQDGCNQFCTYCIIPYVRGRVRSRDKENIVREVIRLSQNSYKEIVLTGIHISSYGNDLQDNDINLLTLILELCKIQGIERIRLGSLEPRIITEDFARLLSKEEKFCPHFHLSLQSGCDETLKRMNRKYTTTEYFNKVNILRKYFKNPAITTDIIVGFPQETKEEFEQTKIFLEKIGFSSIHIFKYSVRKGTKAEKMTGQIDEQTKIKRSKELMKLEQQMKNKYQESFYNNIEKVLFEEEIEVNNIKYQIGHNERYIKIAVNTNIDLNNKILNIKIIKNINDDILLGEII